MRVVKIGYCCALVSMTLLMPATGNCGICTEGVRGPRQEFQLFAGYSPGSPTLIGSETNRQLALAGLSYGYLCWQPGAVSVYYTAAVMPAAILRVPSQTVYAFYGPYRSNAAAHAVYGFGVAPIGFTFEFGRRQVHPFAETMGGVIASTEPIPENQPDASGLNFLFDFGGGVRWNIGPRRAVTLGYRFLHISNAGTTDFNPGVDNNVIYVGYSFRR
jgi:hypothetical protein